MNIKIGHFIFLSFSVSFVALVFFVVLAYFFEAKDAITIEKVKHYETVIEDFEYTINLNIKEIVIPITTIHDIINSKESEQSKRKQISMIMSTAPDIKRIVLIDNNDNIINTYPFSDDLIGINLSEDPTVKEAKDKKHQLVVLGPNVCIIDKLSHYTIPIHYSNYLMLVYLSMDWIKPFIDKFSKIGLYVFTIDNNGTLTTHINQNLAEQAMNIKNIPSVKRAILADKGPFVESIEGENYFIYAKKLEMLNWVIFVGERYDKAYYLVKYIKEKGIIIFFGAITTCLIVSLIISRLFQKPVNLLVKEINKVKKGDYDIHMLDRGFEEIKTISQSLYKMADEIKDREYRFRKIFEDSKNAIILTLKDGTIINANKASIDLFGYPSKDNIIGKNIAHLYSSQSDFEDIISDIKSKGHISNYELEFLKHNNERFHGMLSCSVLKYANEKDEVYMYLIIDLTERKKLLEQLIQAQKMESVGRLTGGIAHDFNNLLTIIYGHAQLMELKHKEDTGIMKHVNAIKKAVERGKDFVKNLLAFSKKQILDLKVYDLNEIIREENRLLTSCIREDILIETHLFDKPCLVNIDRSHFTQILLNLTVNAVDAMPNGGIIKIETKIKKIDSYYQRFEPLSKEGDFVVLSFSDTGEGIPQEVVAKIFDPFFTTKENGTGLGLSMVHGIIAQHGGFINVYSELGKGTTFRIYLPLATKEHDEKQETVSVELDIKGKNALVVEDNFELLEVTKEMLSNLGLNVYAFTDGYQALEEFRRFGNSIDICFIDVVMPKIQGFSLYEQIKEINPDTKTIFLTGYTDNVVHVNFILKQGVHVISKPFSRQDLMLKIKEVLNK
ncbi:MAG: ATP-binding protein [Thermodesulfovibrionales bacterium]|nr:ATP-binding protein [Thermodesulfovibrionales bacterium]